MLRRGPVTVGLVLLAGIGAAIAPRLRSEALPMKVEARKARNVDIVLCLDTSNSMDELIDSARARLWDVVNEVASVEPTARLRVGLLSYGSPSPDGVSSGFVVLQSDLTADLDGLYAKLFGLTTNGGDEYVGWVVDDAVRRLSWSDGTDAAHLIFVAGNESALQGPRDAIAIAQAAQERGFVVNTLYAGSAAQGRDEAWDQVARAGAGRFTAISLADGLVQIATPQDAAIAELNDALNATYVPYGARGEAGRQNQLAQDENAKKLGIGSASTRALAKGKGVYTNEAWDLVDAVQTGAVDVTYLEPSALPAELRDLPAPARQAYVAEQAAKRAELKQRLLDTERDRAAWVGQNAPASSGLDQAMKDIVSEQLK